MRRRYVVMYQVGYSFPEDGYLEFLRDGVRLTGGEGWDLLNPRYGGRQLARKPMALCRRTGQWYARPPFIGAITPLDWSSETFQAHLDWEMRARSVP